MLDCFPTFPTSFTRCGLVWFQTAAAPDTSTYQYDESSGYYYDPQTGLYYDPTTQVLPRLP